MAGKKSIETIRSGEDLIEAISLLEHEAAVQEQYQKELEAESNKEKQKQMSQKQLPPNPLLLGMKPTTYLVSVMKRIRPADLHHALIILPFTTVVKLFHYLDLCIKEGLAIELVCGVLFFLVKVHHKAIIGSWELTEKLFSIHNNARIQIQSQTNILGLNQAALSYLLRQQKTKEKSKAWIE